jgi:hypothetical protein
MSLITYCRSLSITLDGIKELLKYKYRQSTLHISLNWLCRNKKISYDILKCLLEYAGKIASNFAKNNIYTPLHYMCMNDSITLDMLTLLLDYTDDINVITNRLKRTPMHLLCENKNVKFTMLNLMIRRNASLSAKDLYGETSLHYLCGSLCTKELLVWILPYLSKFYEKDNSNSLIAHSLCSNKNMNLEFLTIVLQKTNRRVLNTHNDEELTPINMICHNPALTYDMLKLLIKNGFYNTNMMQSVCLNSALTLDMLKLVLKLKRDKKYLNYTNNSFTPFHKLCWNDSLNFEILKFAFECGADANIRGRNGGTPFKSLLCHSTITIPMLKLPLQYNRLYTTLEYWDINSNIFESPMLFKFLYCNGFKIKLIFNSPNKPRYVQDIRKYIAKKIFLMLMLLRYTLAGPIILDDIKHTMFYFSHMHVGDDANYVLF